MKWFSMNEFECHCGCRMPDGARANIVALVEQVLDPVREKLGKPIRVNSGYRCPRHNEEVLGVRNSQHIKGEAADIAMVHGSRFKVHDLAHAIVENGKFDQLIIYPTFVHVSWKRQGGNRKQILRKTATGYVRVYSL